MSGRMAKAVTIFLSVTFLVFAAAGCSSVKPEAGPDLKQHAARKVDSGVTAVSAISRHLMDDVGQPRVEKISEHVWLAIGYDLANVALIHTGEGNIIVDTAQRPASAKIIKKALSENAPDGHVKAVIYTHSHMDHTGGAGVFAEKDTQIWAADRFIHNFIKQYSTFVKAEKDRGARQFGYSLADKDLPGSAIGPIVRSYSDEEYKEISSLLPTKTFSGRSALQIGGLEIELIEAPGETDDTIYVWIPTDKVLLCADNYYSAFPNLYTIRGASPRPVDGWISSLDEIRRLQPEHLIPGHTRPLHGAVKIQEVITNYRDAIQWVRDDVIRRANEGQDIDTIAENVRLPAHLAELPYLWEGYGQVSWSARAIYTNNLGWFDGRADQLYPLGHKELAIREVGLMGGPEAVTALAEKALQDGDARWAVHLLSKLKDSGTGPAKLNSLLAAGYRQIAAGITNTNGRAYLLVSAQELEMPDKPDSANILNPGLVDCLPIDIIFSSMQQKLDPAKASGINESAHFIFPDIDSRVTVTVRNGIAEVVKGTPLPGTPTPVVTVTSDSLTYKMLAMKMVTAQSVIQQGKLKVEGSLSAFAAFMGRFSSAK